MNLEDEKWTVGGWESLVVNDQNGNTVVACPGGLTLVEMKQRALLISKAPEMLGTLIMLTRTLAMPKYYREKLEELIAEIKENDNVKRRR